MSIAAHPVHASVAFLRVAQFEALSVVEQVARKARLEAHVRVVLDQVVPSDRIVLDAEDGVALVLFGDPARAMDATLSIHTAASREVQAGLDYGPLALSTGGPEARVVGDGLAQAAAAASFASDKLLVTDGFAKCLAATSPDRAAELVPAGQFTDTRVRMHAFHTPDAARRGARRRHLAMLAIGGSAVILLLGVAGRSIYQPMMQSRPAIVTLDVKPRGEVFVDGNSVGRIPPLTQIEVAPGKHRITVRSAGAKPFETMVDLAPAQRLTLSHTFPPPPQKPDFWRDLKRKFGS